MILNNKNYLHASLLLKQLADCGCRKIVISPGSRSTPLALTAADLEGVECFVLPDERSAAFFALGLSKVERMPAVLICTSGTAAANYFPAVIEASQSCVPLIVLTADRPVSLRHTGAPQTIDQTELYGNYVRFYHELPTAALDCERCRPLRTIARQAFMAAVSEPLGPVHVNVPLDEPLAPVYQDAEMCEEIWTELEQEGELHFIHPALNLPTEKIIEQIAEKLAYSLCGLMVAGPDSARSQAEAEAIYLLSRQLGWPLVADIASGLRFYAQPAFPHHDIFLRSAEISSLAPDVVLAFGAHPTSKVLNNYLDRNRAAHTFRIQPHRLGQDPNLRASEMIISDVIPLCGELCELVRSSRDSLLFEPFRIASAKVTECLEQSGGGVCEALFVREATRVLPDGANLVFANSLSIRYGDAFVAPMGSLHPVYAMRGANGIDGTLSHAAGVARDSGKPTLLVTGDLAFLHDWNGLAIAARYAPNLTILLFNNNGGGIFHFLPVHEFENEPQFEAIHGTPHHLNLSAAADLFGLEWRRISRIEEVRDAIHSSNARPRVIEVRIPREENHATHLQLIKRLTEEVTLS
jgi:2-succinyl-5-enolpyruvyl-6-hydroxy-3-cyclohexene-1-carboxylate synthase